MTTSAAFLEEAAACLGPRGLTRDADFVGPWLTDWRGRFTGHACAMASPASNEELARIVRLCAAPNVPLRPQGGNSSMSGGATTDAAGHTMLLSLTSEEGLVGEGGVRPG